MLSDKEVYEQVLQELQSAYADTLRLKLPYIKALAVMESPDKVEKSNPQWEQVEAFAANAEAALVSDMSVTLTSLILRKSPREWMDILADGATGRTAEVIAIGHAWESVEEIGARLDVLGADLAVLLEGQAAQKAVQRIRDAKACTDELWTLLNKRMSDTMR
jgi:hypothetical protein